METDGDRGRYEAFAFSRADSAFLIRAASTLHCCALTMAWPSRRGPALLNQPGIAASSSFFACQNERSGDIEEDQARSSGELEHMRPGEQTRQPEGYCG